MLCSPVANLTVLLANLAAGALCVCMCLPVALLPCQVLLYNTSSCLYTQTHPLPENTHTYKRTAFITVSFMYFSVQAFAPPAFM